MPEIRGVGIDAIEIDRVAEALARYGERFERRVFTEAEIAYCRRRRNPAPHFAGRFAVKEAGMKALGTGWSRGVQWRDLEVQRGAGGPPRLVFHGAADRRFASIGGQTSLVTITHSRTLAIAQVILLG